MFWDLINLLLVAYLFVFIPILLAFDDKLFEADLFRPLNILVIILFIFDILINFNTGVFIKGEIKMERETIKNKYL